jgi:GR25 family glycosyltransferase involved in LPS biosynthesis
MPHAGYYINLDRSTARRAFMERQLRDLRPAAPYTRFPAADGNPYRFPNPTLTDAQIGCFTSHYMLLRTHLDRTDYAHILEDDALLAHRTVQFVEQIIASGMLEELDILFTSAYLPQDFGSFQSARSAFRTRIVRAEDGTAAGVQFMTLPYFASTTSYLVNPKSVRAIHDILGRELARGVGRPIDLFIRDEAEKGNLRVRCLFPFISSVMPVEFASTIDQDDDKRRWTCVMDLLRHSFFVECDLPATLALAERVLSTPGADLQERLHARIAGYLSSDSYRTH